MADMTQPEMPERASIPDNESQPSEDIVEPIHIGVARHRETRESFTPPPLQTPDTGLTAPTGPADRTAVESLRREAERLTSQGQPIEAPSILLGEPSMPRQEGGMPLKAKVGAVAGALAVAAGGFLGFNKIRSGDDGGERPGVIITNPTLKPTEPAPTIVPTKTPEAPTATQTPEVEKYPREMGSTYTFGNTTFEFSKTLQETGVDYFGEKIKVNEVYLNTESYPDAEEKLNEGIMYGQYLAWKTGQEGREGVTFEEFKQRVDSGEDMSYTIFGYKEDAALDYGEVKVDPLKPVHIVLLDGPAPVIKLGINAWGYRVLNGELYIEMYDQKGYEVNDDTPNRAYAAQALATNLEWALALLSDREAQERKGLVYSGNDEFMTKYIDRIYEFDRFFIPSKTPTFWNSILRVK